jgi:hypothetical protein
MCAPSRGPLGGRGVSDERVQKAGSRLCSKQPASGEYHEQSPGLSGPNGEDGLMQERTDVNCMHARRRSLHARGLGVDGVWDMKAEARVDLTRKRVKPPLQLLTGPGLSPDCAGRKQCKT